MIKPDEIKYSLSNLFHRKLRSFLSALSILIGIAAIFALVSFGFGMQNYIDTLAKEAGVDKLFIMSKGIGAPGSDENFYLTAEDISFVEKIKGVREISGMYAKSAEIKFDDAKKYSFLIGMNMEKSDFILEAMGVDVIKGRQLKKEETGKVVLGYNYQLENKIFKKPVRLGDKVEVNGYKLEVAGFYEEVGNPQDDSQVYVTSEQAEIIFDDIKDKYGYVMLRSDPNVNATALADRIKEKLRKHKGQEEGKEDFYVQTFEDALAIFTNIVLVLNGILVLIALISLIVATVNIMNTMYTAVLERTKEIGVMKAVGAKNSTILTLFVMESGFLGLIGGAAGVVFGYIIAKIGGNIAASAGYALLKPYFPWYLAPACLLFAFLVGSLAGYFPAKQASKLKPVDALRYE